MQTEEPIILLVDDSQHDVRLTRIVFERAGFKYPLQNAVDGEDAIAYLQGTGHYGDRIRFPLPTVILLDLNMPKMNGFEVLAWIRAQPTFRRLTVYVLSSSQREEDIAKCYDLGANSYLVKPIKLDGLAFMAQSLLAWLKLCHFTPLPLGVLTSTATTTAKKGGKSLESGPMQEKVILGSNSTAEVGGHLLI